MIYHVIQGRSASADGDAQHVPTGSRDQAVACALDALRILLTR